MDELNLIVGDDTLEANTKVKVRTSTFDDGTVNEIQVYDGKTNISLYRSKGKWHLWISDDDDYGIDLGQSPPEVMPF